MATFLLKRLVILVLSLIVVLSLPAAHERWLYFSTGKAVVMLTLLENPRSGGTGFQINTSRGPRVVTNAHICGSQLALLASNRWGSIRVRVLKVLKVDKKKDLCILESFPELPALSLSPAPSLPLDVVRAVGHPALEAVTMAEGYNRGRVRIMIGSFSIKEEDCRELYVEPFCYQSFDSISTSIKIYGGNSGSPVINSFGGVVGVIFAGNPRTSNGHYVPWRHLKSFLEEL